MGRAYVPIVLALTVVISIVLPCRFAMCESWKQLREDVYIDTGRISGKEGIFVVYTKMIPEKDLAQRLKAASRSNVTPTHIIFREVYLCQEHENRKISGKVYAGTKLLEDRDMNAVKQDGHIIVGTTTDVIYRYLCKEYN